MKFSRRQLLIGGAAVAGVGAFAAFELTGDRKNLIPTGGTSIADSDLTNYLQRWTTAPSPERVTKLNRLITDLKAANLWDKLDAIWDLQSESRITSCYNLKGTGYDLQIEGTVLHRNGFGFTGDGITGFLRTGIMLGEHIGQFSTNSASLGVVCVNHSNGSNQYLFGSQNGNLRLKSRQAPIEAPSGFLNDVTEPLTGEKGSGYLPGLIVLSRTAADKMSIYKGGIPVGRSSSQATEMKPGELWLGRYANRFNSETLSFAFVGGGLNDADVTKINEIIRDYVIWSMRPIMCFGDSLTQGVRNMGKSPMGGASSYPSVLQSLTLRQTINGGISGQKSDQIRDRALSDNFFNAAVNVIWSGRNNYLDQEAVLADTQKMVEHLTHDRYIIPSILNGEYAVEHKGEDGYKKLLELNEKLEDRYTDRYLDLRSILVSAGRKQDANDELDVGNDVVPRSLRSDTIHLNDIGDNIVAQAIASFIESKGW